MEATCLLRGYVTFGRAYFPLRWRSQTYISGYKQSYLNSKKINCMECPAQSADLNPRENLWGELNRRWRLRQENSKTWRGIMDKSWENIWAEISTSTYQTLIEPMPWRVEAVVLAKDGKTRYWERRKMSGHALRQHKATALFFMGAGTPKLGIIFHYLQFFYNKILSQYYQSLILMWGVV